MSSAAKLFLKLTGSSSGLIRGEAKVVNFKDQIELNDWKWALNRKDKGGNSENAKAEPSIFGFSKQMDRATTAMLGSMRSGEPMDAVISMEESSREQFRLIVTLEGVLITSYDFSTQVSDGSASIDESWEFDYESVRFDYRSSAKEGMSTWTLMRPPGASTKAPDNTPAGKMVELGKDISLDKIDDVWKNVKASAGMNLLEKK